MHRDLFLLKDVSRILGVRPHRVNYAITSGGVTEPELRIGNRRIFQAEDISRLKRYFDAQKEKNEPKRTSI